MTPIDGKCQNLKTSFVTFFIFAKVWPMRTILTDRNWQVHSYKRNVADFTQMENKSMTNVHNLVIVNRTKCDLCTEGYASKNCKCLSFNESAIKYSLKIFENEKKQNKEY